MTELNPLQTAAGVGLGVLADAFYKASGSPDVGPVEHSHIGLASIIAAMEYKPVRSFGTGFGATLLVQDLFYGNLLGANVGTPQDKQFSLGLDAIEIGIILARYSRSK